jgi:uncharacterized protein (DUF924 family)
MSSLLPQNILDFWFSERVSKFWFNSSPEFDQELRDRFEALLNSAVRGDLNCWEQTADGALALAVALDQFPLNMYRGKAESYATGDLAVTVAKAAVAQGLDQQLPRERVIFLYLPLMHSENLADQDQSVELIEKAELSENLRFAKHHREIVRSFGRFPHRNAALGRESTAEEINYLASKAGYQG